MAWLLDSGIVCVCVIQLFPPSRYFSGHDHNMQYIQESNSPVSYFVTGAGRLTDSSEKHKVSTLQQHKR